MVCRSASSSVFVYRSLRWPMAHVLRGRASPRSGESRCDVSRSLYYMYYLIMLDAVTSLALSASGRLDFIFIHGIGTVKWVIVMNVLSTLDHRPLFADLPSVTEWRGGSELEIEARFGNKRRGNTATRCRVRSVSVQNGACA